MTLWRLPVWIRNSIFSLGSSLLSAGGLGEIFPLFFFFHSVLCVCFLPTGNEVYTGKWVTVSPVQSSSGSVLSFIIYVSFTSRPSSSPFHAPSRVTASHSVSFQLIDTFALEIGELKKEMVQVSHAVDKDPVELQGWACFLCAIKYFIPDFMTQIFLFSCAYSIHLEFIINL